MKCLPAPSLLETLSLLTMRRLFTAQKVKRISLRWTATVVELDDGSVGSSMNYFFRDPLTNAEVLRRLGHFLESIHLFIDEVEHTIPGLIFDTVPDLNQGTLIYCALLCALVNALSDRCIRNGGDDLFTVQTTCPEISATRMRRALVVGFGGYLNTVARCCDCEFIQLLDLTYPRRKREIDAHMALLRSNREFYASVCDALPDDDPIWKSFDFAAISASALSNGTLESLLERLPADCQVVLQGQSGCVHPAALFRRGISWVTTTLKTPALMDAAEMQDGGVTLKRLLNAGTSWVHLIPTEQMRSDIVPGGDSWPV